MYNGSKFIVRGVPLSFCFIFLLVVSGTAQTPTPTPKSDASVKLETETQKIKDQIVKIGTGNDITISRRDGQEFYGTVLTIGNDSLFIHDVDLKAKVEIYFQQIKKISKGYGDSKAWNGKRIPPKKHAIGLAIGLAAILIPILIVGLSLGKD